MEFEFHGPPGKTACSDFEAEFDVQLPDDYKKFLNTYGGGGFSNTMFWIPVLNEFTPLDCLQGLTPDPNGKGTHLSERQSWYREWELHPAEIIIGDCAFGSPLILNCSPDFSGIYYYDRLAEHANSNEIFDLYFIAYTFDDFLRMLQINKKGCAKTPVWPQALQWPDPLPKNKIKRWKKRKPAIWPPGNKPIFDPAVVPEAFRNARLLGPNE